MRKIYPVIFLCVLGFTYLNAQTNTFPSTGAAGIGTLTPDASSLLDIKSTAKGILIPRMTKAQRDLIASPIDGLLIYQNNSTPGFYYYNGTAWTAISTKGANTKLSNLVAPTAVNQSLLPGVSNSIDLGSPVNLWKNAYFSGDALVNGITIGRGGSAIASNTATGDQALYNNTSGNQNTANGGVALFSNTTGTYNTASGYVALYSNSTGSANTANGYGTLNHNTSGSSNTANGFYALFYNSTGYYNTASGINALYSNTTGYYNSAFGISTLFNNTTGYSNVGIGSNSLFSNKTTSNLVAVGDSALYKNTGAYNTAIGSKTLYNNITGIWNTGNGYQALFNNNNGNYNTATGAQSLHLNTNGTGNTANGYSALAFNTTGSSNTANGASALVRNTTGSFNTANGQAALSFDTSGSGNTADGYIALYSNTAGSNNTALGFSALENNSTGHSNVAVGTHSLYSNTTSSNLVAVGDSALYHNTGGYNTAAGSKALFSNTAGNNNTANGYQALYFNTTGGANTATGYRALYFNTAGENNIAIGNQAVYNNIGGNMNIGLGYYTLFNNSGGNENTAVGNWTLKSNTTGSDNTALGYYADVSSGTLTNAMALGYGATVNASNKVVIGSNTVGMVIGGYAPWSNLSDGRFKENVKEDVPGLKFITKLHPVTYTINTQKLEEHIMQNMPDDIKAARKQTPEQYAKAKSKIQTGFVAQEVEKTAKEIGYNFDGVNAPQNETDNYSIAYSQFVVPLVKAVQELSKQNDGLGVMNDELKTKNELQDKKIAAQQEQIDELKKMMQTFQQNFNNCNPCGTNALSQQSAKVVSVSSASLQQNIPNPFNRTTTINYVLAQQYSSAKIIVVDKSGKTLKEINISGTGKGSIAVDASTLASGAYNYSLYIDGKLISTKQMEHIK